MPWKSSIMPDIQQFITRKEEIRAGLLSYTRKAFYAIPAFTRPRILDLGCGEGVPTIELARLSDGTITGIDIDRKALIKLNEKACKSGLCGRVGTIRGTLLYIPLAAGSFDIVWSEGAINVIGFNRALSDWGTLLREGGFMALHDEQGNVKDKLEQIRLSGYKILDYFMLGSEVWFDLYFSPLQRLIDTVSSPNINDDKLNELIAEASREIAFFSKYPERSSSAFFILQKC